MSNIQAQIKDLQTKNPIYPKTKVELVEGLQTELNTLDTKINNIQSVKLPNVIILGTPTILDGNVSSFSTVNNLQLPFILDVRNKVFAANFSFTTNSNINTLQTILDSDYGIRFGIENGKGLLALSSDGESWDIGEVRGTFNFATVTTYFARLLWNKTNYQVEISTNNEFFVPDITIASSLSIFPKSVYVGGKAHPFKGSINLNKCDLSIGSLDMWQGMDDAGLISRASVSLSNLDSLGLQKIKDTVQPELDNKQGTLSNGVGISIQNNVVSVNVRTLKSTNW